MKVALNFRSSYQNREVVTFGGVEISFIRYNDLIADKKANSRPKDIHDIDQLELRRKQHEE